MPCILEQKYGQAARIWLMIPFTFGSILSSSIFSGLSSHCCCYGNHGMLPKMCTNEQSVTNGSENIIMPCQRSFTGERDHYTVPKWMDVILDYTHRCHFTHSILENLRQRIPKSNNSGLNGLCHYTLYFTKWHNFPVYSVAVKKKKKRKKEKEALLSVKIQRRRANNPIFEFVQYISLFSSKSSLVTYHHRLISS